MNGPRHYVEAERLLAVARALDDDAGVLAAAQVHATLALAAATALAIDPTPEADDEVVEANIACGTPLNPGQDEPSCVLDDGHEDYHSDGHGNRWTT